MSTIVSEPPVAQKPEKATLRRQLLFSLLAPIVLVSLISSVVSYYYAFNFATLAYDYSLFDSALDISRQIHTADGQVHVDLPRAALDMLEYDGHDRIYYQINDATGAFVAGHRGLPLPGERAPPGKPVYYDGSYGGSPVRIAALYSMVSGTSDPGPILIQVAETLNKRHILADEILLGMLWPELLLIVLVGVLVWYGVERGLRPLAALQREISRRSHRDLSPLAEHNVPGEVHALIHAMNGLLARLSEAMSAQQRFIADAAHQLRTPLAGLKTQTELALRQQELSEVRHTLQHLHTATGRTTHLVNQLLSLARAEPGAVRAHALTALNLDDLARDTTTEWVPRAIERNIDLGFDGTPAAAGIEGDVLLIREMLGNLLDNAIRYTPSGGRVTVRVAAERDQVELSVEDNGPGIPPAGRERVFERFHRVLGSGAEGCGLGLAIVHEIAQSHNAKTRLGPGPGGRGTRVTVAFPRAA
ncbi:MAG: sensor histidine kinase N-terminal domain-containing protein [Betaproteobacteria bacterium]|nr:sensor histidine kinase N-terminal domain-containing protein [Betaproteobacteria bacterium]